MDSVSGLASFTGSIKTGKASSVSGSVQLYLDECEEVHVSTMSGFIAFDLGTIPKTLQVDTTSGNVDITIPKDASCTVKLDAMSGKLYMNESTVSSRQLTLGEGTSRFDIDSMSGSVYIHTK